MNSNILTTLSSLTFVVERASLTLFAPARNCYTVLSYSCLTQFAFIYIHSTELHRSVFVYLLTPSLPLYHFLFLSVHCLSLALYLFLSLIFGSVWLSAFQIYPSLLCFPALLHCSVPLSLLLTHSFSPCKFEVYIYFSRFCLQAGIYPAPVFQRSCPLLFDSSTYSFLHVIWRI